MKNTHDKFDDLVRRRLGELPPATPSETGWARLEERIAHPEDQLLKEALTSLPPATPIGWEALERRLSPKSPADADVAGKLNSLTPTAGPGAWAAFAEVMAARVDAEVDAVVQDKLAMSSAGPVTGWAALAARLELIRERRQRLAAWKITELSLMASFLLLLVRFMPMGDQAINTYPTPVASNADRVEANTAGVAAASMDDMAATVTASASRLDGVATSKPSKRLDQYLAQSSPSAAKAPKIVAPRPYTDPPRITERGQVGDQFSAATTAQPAAVAEAVDNRQAAAAAASVPGAQPQAVDYLAEHPQRSILITSAPYEKKARPQSTYIDVFASPFDINQVVTSYIPVFDLEVLADNRFTQGSSLGVMVESKWGRSGVQFGALYSEISYIPTALKWYLQEEYPVFEPIKGYSRFNYARVEVPISYNQVFAETDKWRWSARATASLSVIARSSFFVEDDEILKALNSREERGAAVDQNTVGGGAGRDVANLKDVRQLEDPPLGVFQGGSLFANSGFYLGGGITVERILSPRSSVYFSPTFGRAVYLNPEKIGLGPYQDRIHTGQLRFGARYKLSKKK